MFNLLKRKLSADPAPASVPAGLRVYAIGDVHGRSDLLDRLLVDIEQDDANRGPADTHIVLLGDLVDRGPDSAGVIERLVSNPPSFARLRCIQGNHEEALLRAWRGESEHDRAWLSYGGQQTLESYGIHPGDFFLRGFNIHDEMHRRIPASHIAFIEGCEQMIRFGDYLFVHAGIRPGVALEEQRPRDLRWIREDFLNDRRHHGAVIVHGHTISEEPELLANRLGIDTGAYKSGRLTGLGLEGTERWLINT